MNNQKEKTFTSKSIIVCDKCEKEFTLSKGKLQETSLRKYVRNSENVNNRSIPKDVNITFFSCPSCSHRYVVILTNLESRKLLEEVKQYQKRIANMKLTKTVSRTLLQMTYDKAMLLQEKVGQINSELKKQYEEIL